jgi:hypothetical protein
MPVSTLPALDRTSSTFKADVDTFFGTQLPAFTSEINALESNVNAKEASAVAAASNAAEQADLATSNGAAQVALAAAQVSLAAEQADLATSNGAAQVALAAAQVSLAAEQADLATSNGAAQVALAAAQVALAAEQADLATSNGAAQVALAAAQVSLAAEQADLALSYSQVAASAINFLGDWAAQTGPVAAFKTVFHSGKYWIALNAIPDVTTSEPGISGDWAQTNKSIDRYDYDSRGDLRSTTPRQDDAAIVAGLGLFIFYESSDEPDDDESCFAVATGRWLLEAASWDLVSAWQLPDDEARDAWDEDEPLRIAAAMDNTIAEAVNNALASAIDNAIASKFLHGTATSAITSVNAVTQVSFTGTVAGAAVGDTVIANPPDALGARLSVHCRVTAPDTVTIYLNNPSAATQSIAAGTWTITVVKE